MKLYIHEKECCGCEACVNICPVHAIEMKANSIGELFPQVNEEVCIKCGKCIKVCDLKKEKSGFRPISAYGAVSKNLLQYKQSTSGGVFAALAEEIIERKGVAIGATLEYNDGVLDVYHEIIRDKSLLFKLQGSKYVQSRMEKIFFDIQMLLEEEIFVLFSGTPCQVAGLKSFLGKEYDNLFTVDIVCHGVPSIKLLENHIHYIEKEKGVGINNIEFRKKGSIHSGIDVRYSYKDNKEKEKYMDIWPVLDSYYQLFLDGQIYRESCYSCKYANDLRQGDISICDFWGADKELPEKFFLTENITLKDGFSGILVNTIKGEALFKDIKNKMKYVCVAPEQIIKWNAQLEHSSKKGEFWEEIRVKYIESPETLENWYLKKYSKQIKEYKIRELIVKFSSSKMRSKIKKLLR